MIQTKFAPLARETKLLPGMAMRKRELNRAYLMRLKPENLLLSHYVEAGLAGRINYEPQGIHWGWDGPLSDIRGTVCGHWLSAAAHIVHETGDVELLARAQYIVGEIRRCQERNGGQWAFPIPEKFMYWLRDGKAPWAPQYVCHKNMMGLLDMYLLTGNELALEIVKACADWFHDFTDTFGRETMDEMMDVEETGGIMEFWADLYAVTSDARHLELMRRYERPRLADKLLQGVDMLTNMHANATVPEIQGYARAYEVTGEKRYRDVVEAYWNMAVTERGMFATGGQTSGEVWTPMGRQAARLGDKNQEHCVVYNMMRLAMYLMKWTGESQYADYWECNLFNGIYAQGYWEDLTDQMIGGGGHYHEVTTVAYYLPMHPGSHKHWGSETHDFWCCHCTLLQANAIHGESIYFTTEKGVAVAQYLPARLEAGIAGTRLCIEQTIDPQAGTSMLHDVQANRDMPSRPHSLIVWLDVHMDEAKPVEFKLRMPGWLSGEMQVLVDGEPVSYLKGADGYAALILSENDQRVTVVMPKRLSCYPLPDDPDMVAFMDGPVCLAGLVPEEHLLYGDKQNPEGSLLCADDERQWQDWRLGWKTFRQPFGIRFRPLYQIGHEPYTIYFPVVDQPVPKPER